MTTPYSSADPAPRFLVDVNFNARIRAGLRRLLPDVDWVTAQELGLGQMPDPELLVEAKRLGRILLTHDINTMPGHFDAFIADLQSGEDSPGVMLIPQDLPIGLAIEALSEVCQCSNHSEWRNQFTYLPL